ncbi:helix-turn-helix transcriptional regulator [Streptomyces mirabilis]|uniref:helix-turn-helix transcriptional regulator n=1 Tax=Streptomyces mirabilis TaxID=68239 RepID=UPI00382EF3E2
MEPHTAQATLVGREAESAQLGGLIQDVSAGLGRAVWVEGDPGIGKTSLVTSVLQQAAGSGCRTAWAAADEFQLLSPLRVLTDGLSGCAQAGDGRLEQISRLLRGVSGPTALDDTDPVHRATEQLLTTVDEVCGAGPLVLVADDIQWADEASLIAWRRLAQSVEQLPLLLIAACRPVPQREAVRRLRQSVLARDGIRLPVGPLSQGAVHTLVTRLTGAPPGPRLQRLASHAAGNPLYLRELVDSLLHDGAVAVVGGQAEVSAEQAQKTPLSLSQAIRRRVELLPGPLLDLLGAAALFGREFTVTDLAAVMDTSPTTLLTGLRQAAAAGLVDAYGISLRLSHPLVRQILFDRLPPTLRVALHRQAAQVLAESGAAPDSVAEQLLAVPWAADGWTQEWVATHADALTRQSPRLAAPLLARLVNQRTAVGTARHEVFVSTLATALFRLGQPQEAERHAWNLLTHSQDAQRAAEMRWILARVFSGTNRSSQAYSVTVQALRRTDLPARWRGRFQALSALLERERTGDLERARLAAHDALTTAERTGDRFGTGYALCALWVVDSTRRDHPQALAHLDRALTVFGEEPQFGDLRSWAWGNRALTLHSLDRLADAQAGLGEALARAERNGDPESPLHIAAAVHHFWTGSWDDAQVCLDSVTAQGPQLPSCGLNECLPTVVLHGVAALIASHRDDRESARRHLEAGTELLTDALPDRDSRDFLVAAQALEAERNGSADQALDLLETMLDRHPGQLNPAHPWLPSLVRLALERERGAVAQAALAACEAEDAAEVLPARAAWAAAHCRALVDGNPEPCLAAAAHYAAVGRTLEHAQCLEDAAVLLARDSRQPKARTALAEAAEAYTRMGAEWDLRRADTRLRPYGIRRGVRGPRARAAFGWSALSPTELQVARLVAEGKSNPQVAAELFLSRRTIQTHVSHILRKLGVRSRVEIATEALRHAQKPSAV